MDAEETRRFGVMKATIPVGIFVVLLVVLVLALSGGGGGAPERPEAFADAQAMDAAIERAREEHRVVFAVATADWCSACRKYERGALSDERVSAWIGEHAVPVYLDVTEGANATTDRLGVNAIPASFVIDGEGGVVAQWLGAVTAEEVLEKLSDAAATEAVADGP